MASNYETIEARTDKKGYFYAIDFYTCGGIINKCDDSFTAIFEKEGYKTLELKENYLLDSETGYLNEIKKDTVTFLMIPIIE
ncbi:hypothetical protein [Plebeiibacterium sediminum]|uniref:Uncharacterized protein n=1 Tax=Plebeiibacterium sediminum TaxID=2992112 RepID=A0AAE3SGI5_9BACT|nr:hypothetical protein [Plebeiobacterium sediminum]MCW3788132.1 hypothetical protein [Plebeiobacterium sediminum]